MERNSNPIKEDSNEKPESNPNENLLENIVNICLSDRSYEPNVFSREFQLREKRFRDKRTGKIVNHVFPYLMPQIHGRRVIGMYDSSVQEITNDILQKDDGHSYENTYRHEQGHATKGRGEFEAVRYASDNYNSYETAA